MTRHWGTPIHRVTIGVAVWIFVLGGNRCEFSIRIVDHRYYTNCSTALLAELDSFTVMGTVSTAGVKPDFLQIKAYVLSQDSSPVTICMENLSSCGGRGCYCELLRKGESYRVTINRTLTSWFSNKTLQLELKNRYSGVKAFSNHHSLPEVFEKGTEVLSLKVNYAPVNYLMGPGCRFPLNRCTNTVALCCSRSPTPCVTSLVHGKYNMSGQPCVRIRPAFSATGEYRVAYSVCGRPAKTHYVCTAYTNLTQDHHSLRINGRQVTTKAGDCSLKVPLMVNMVEYCCSQHHQACSATISLTGQPDNHTGSPCVATYFHGALEGEMVFSFSVCHRHSQTYRKCLLNEHSLLNFSFEKHKALFLMVMLVVISLVIIAVLAVCILICKLRSGYRRHVPGMNVKPAKSALVKPESKKTNRPPRSVTFSLSKTSYR